MPDIYARNIAENFNDEGQEIASTFAIGIATSTFIAANANKRTKILGICYLVQGGLGAMRAGVRVGASATDHFVFRVPTGGGVRSNQSHWLNFQPTGWTLPKNTALLLSGIGPSGVVQATAWYKYID